MKYEAHFGFQGLTLEEFLKLQSSLTAFPQFNSLALNATEDDEDEEENAADASGAPVLAADGTPKRRRGRPPKNAQSATPAPVPAPNMAPPPAPMPLIPSPQPLPMPAVPVMAPSMPASAVPMLTTPTPTAQAPAISPMVAALRELGQAYITQRPDTGINDLTGLAKHFGGDTLTKTPETRWPEVVNTLLAWLQQMQIDGKALLAQKGITI